jgi:hypothetical protein
MLVRSGWLKTGVLVLVLVVWAIMCVVGSITHDWQGVQAVNVLMVIVVGSVFAIHTSGGGK